MSEINTNYNALIKKGILISENLISKDKINLISGATTAPLIETIWTFSGNNIEAINRISDMLTKLYSTSRGSEMLDILRILFDVVGMEFPEDVNLLATHPKAQRYFLFSFLLDMDDCMQDFMPDVKGE
ncbi:MULTISPECIES: hypothetical protein [unclassified Dehalobacter]|uniref:hypothetical protein n=1 Tax=unclassified Dehalobacter TaxID=2635733 RepID=UPI00028AF333|nr:MULTISPECIES: hypothetical protein [unclassified Dehalobacter]AFV01099.1 hypothetical protein DHBDCA_p71 [Dehalobacter sp. DCA]AFV04139.1 hypothetical protein DCF50_p133 [Dehalobacter sp. CF]